LAGEKYLNPDNYETGLEQDDEYTAFGGNGPDHTRYSSWGPAVRDRAGMGLYPNMFGSCHAGGCNMTLCDGSVRQISYGVSKTVFKNLGNRASGTPIDVTDLNM
jgi:prepilin-type processing-associated H-X9-DG protein